MAGNRRLSTLSDHTSDWRAREAEIARIAAAQHDQLTFAQLLAAGKSEVGIRHRTRTGRLHRACRRVYSLGHPPTSSLEHWMAAVLACGRNAALSHASAAANLGIRPSAATVIDVTSPTGAGRGIKGIRAHRSRLAPEEVTMVSGIPTTTVARTLLDLAEVLSPRRSPRRSTGPRSSGSSTCAPSRTRCAAARDATACPPDARCCHPSTPDRS